MGMVMEVLAPAMQDGSDADVGARCLGSAAMVVSVSAAAVNSSPYAKKPFAGPKQGVITDYGAADRSRCRGTTGNTKRRTGCKRIRRWSKRCCLRIECLRYLTAGYTRIRAI
jgi:hypothetical protein